MKKVLAFCALAMFVMPAVAGAAELVDTFKATIDGSFCTAHGSGWTEGYGNAGASSFPRLMKGHQHMGYMDWDGTVGGTSGQGLASFINAGGGVVKSAYLYIHVSPAAGPALGGKGAIITLRTSNVGNVVEDDGLGSASYNGNLQAYNVAGSSGAVAFRMADYSLAPGYVNNGEGIDKFGDAAFAGEAWKRPSTGNPAGSKSGSFTFKPGDECYDLNTSNPRRGFWDSELWGVEGVVGFHWSQASNDVARLEAAGQLVNKNPDNSFLFFDPVNMIASQDANGTWYKVPINPAIVLDLANNTENKGVVFSNWVAGGTGGTSYNNNFDSKDHEGGAWAPYLEVTTPEPMTLVLLSLGGLALIRRRR